MEKKTDQLHPELHKDLKRVTDIVNLKSLENVHNALMGVLDEERTPMELSDFDHPDHLNHTDFIDESHHDFMIQMLNQLIEDLEPKDHLIVYEFIKSLHDRSKNIHDEHLADHDFDHPEKINARNFHEIIDRAHELVKEKILFNLDLPADTELSESDFYRLLIEQERDSILNILNDQDSNYKLGDNLENHHVKIIKDHHDKKTNITDLIDIHIKKYESESSFNENDKTTYYPAFKEDKERFENKIPLTIQKATLTISQACVGMDKWAFFGSTAVSVQSENYSDNIDDIDMVFDVNDLDKFQKNLDSLAANNTIYQDNNGEKSGYNIDKINLFGDNIRLSGFIDSGEKNPTDPTKNILVPFEAFAEDKDHGVTQIGHLPTRILKLDQNGTNIQMLERESLIDHYTVIALSELYNDNFEKDKDILRLQKIEQFGINMFDGFKEAIKRIYTRYPHTQNEKMKDILAKSEKCLNMIETAKQEFQNYIQKAGHHGESADIKSRLAEFSNFYNFKDFFEALKSRKQFFKEKVKEIESAENVDQVLSIHRTVHQEIDHFNDVFNAIKINPEGKALYYLAMKRFIVKFLKDLYQKMDKKLDQVNDKKLSDKEIKEVINILKRSASYTEFKLYNYKYPEEE